MVPAVHGGRPGAMVTRTTEKGMGTMNGENDREAVTASRVDSLLDSGASKSNGGTTTATRTVTYHMTVNTDAWAGTYGLKSDKVQAHVAEWLDNATNHLGLPSDAVGDIVAVPARREHVELSGIELREWLWELTRDPDRVHTLRFEFRRDGMAVKVNEGMWSPTVGHVVAAK